MKAQTLLIITLSTLFNWGCTSNRTIPPELLYQPPVGGDIATITGSKDEGFWYSEYTHVSAINGKRVPEAKQHSDEVLTIPAGQIVVSITYKDSDDVVSSDVEFEALPGRSYQTGFLSELESEYADLWVTDLDSGKAISTLSRAVFPKRKTTYVPMPIYTPQPTPIYAPIYTPLPMPY